MNAFDAIVVGAGQAGPSLAVRLAKAGKKVALVERHLVGGTCVNAGCMPTKTLVASAYAAHLARRAGDYGVVLEGDVGVDMKRVRARQDKVVHDARSGLQAWLAGTPNLTLITGHARFDSPGVLTVGDQRLTAKEVFLNVGGRALIPDLPGVQDVAYLTSASMLALDVLPRHLVIVGGSYIGLEFAQMYRRFGARVTVVEKGERLIQREDPDVSAAVQAVLEREGVAFRLGAECITLAHDADGVSVGVDCESGERAVIGSHILLAVGRKPNTDDLNLAAAGVSLDARGYIIVDGELRTSAANVWALGDCNGRGAFTHTAYNDYEIVAANLLDGGARRITDRLPAYALYVDPPLGRCGMSLTEARASGRRLLVGERPMSRVGRATEKGETDGFMRIVVDADSREILGASILGTSGDEAVHSVLDMMYARAPFDVLRQAVHIHPTVSELIPTLLAELRPDAG